MKRFVVFLTAWAMGLAWAVGGVAPATASAQIPVAAVASAVSTPGGFTSLAQPALSNTSIGTRAVVARDAAGLLWLYPGNGAGGFQTRRQIGSGWNVMTAIVTPGDVTGDGNADILARDSLGRLWLYPGNATGGLSTRRQIGSGWNIMNAVTSAANLNGTGRPDLLARDTAGVLWLYPLSGNAVFGARTRIGTGWNGYTFRGPGDFSGDGRADILARDSAGRLWLYRGNGIGGVTSRTLVSGGWAGMNALVTPGNWDAAVGNDLLTRDAPGRLWLYPGNNAGGFGAARQVGSGWQGMTYIGGFSDTPAGPGPVTNVTAAPASKSIALTWTNPDDASLTGVMIRRSEGAIPPETLTAGIEVQSVAASVTSFTDDSVPLSMGTQYSYGLFAHDASQHYATAATVTATTRAAGAMSGRVTDAGGTHHGLEGASVGVYSATLGFRKYVPTAADGSYTVTGLEAAADYQVCFNGYPARGGSADAWTYVSQCWQNQPFSTWTPVTVTSGATSGGISAALSAAGALSGTVTDAAGTHHGLAGVEVKVSVPSDPNGCSYPSCAHVATTAADGSYTVTGLDPGTDYKVCFTDAGLPAKGGSSDATGYISQCWQNQPAWSTSTSVAVTSAATSSGINAALEAAAGISGKVTDAGGTLHGLANVAVTVTSSTRSTHTTTAADGSYSMRLLAPGSDYTVCFSAPSASGGSSGQVGYLSQCWQNQSTPGTRTPITLASGTTTTGINAALTAAAAISGTVTDAGGTFQGLANVWVTVTSSGGSTRFLTGASGTYVIRGLPSGSDYTVCFFVSHATGGSSDATGYVDQCWQNKPTSGTPTPVTLMLGATTTGIDAAVVGVG